MYRLYYSRRRFGSRTYPTQCRYCGKEVRYYENEYGSRVFFDHLGPPWPKHRCREYLNRHNRNK